MTVLLRPRWLALHLLAVVMVVTMVLLGRWQLIVSDEHGFELRNFGYAVQWWVFAGFTGWFWWRLMRDAVRPSAPAQAEVEAAEPEPVAYRRYVAPAARPVRDDPELAAYNDYLARLAEKDAE